MTPQTLRDWDVLLSQISAARLIIINGGHRISDCSQAVSELDKAYDTAETLREAATALKAGEAIGQADGYIRPVSAWACERGMPGCVVQHRHAGESSMCMGFLATHDNGRQAGETADPASPAEPDYVAALADLEFARDSHLKWAEHLEAHEASGQPCAACDSKPYKLTAPYEREWVAKYDRIIGIVKREAVSRPRAEGTTHGYVTITCGRCGHDAQRHRNDSQNADFSCRDCKCGCYTISGDKAREVKVAAPPPTHQERRTRLRRYSTSSTTVRSTT